MTEKSSYLLEYARVFSIVSKQRAFRNRYRKKHHPTRAFCYSITNSRKQVACVKSKAEASPKSQKKAIERVRQSFVGSQRELPPVNMERPEKKYRKFYEKKLNF
ncbi:hypothetical protein TNCV_1210961 [Trichonephila clavipes]|nr:hypothetical protein TNCV_1210961 [Trichonephila clavipes]